MIRKCTLFFALSLFSLTTLSAPAHGDVRETESGIEVWHMTVSGWVSPDEFFDIEIKRLKGPTYGTVEDYPLHAGGRILPELSPGLSEFALRKMSRRGLVHPPERSRRPYRCTHRGTAGR